MHPKEEKSDYLKSCKILTAIVLRLKGKKCEASTKVDK